MSDVCHFWKGLDPKDGLSALAVGLTYQSPIPLRTGSLAGRCIVGNSNETFRVLAYSELPMAEHKEEEICNFKLCRALALTPRRL